MYVLGLTGSIGMGKSVAAEMFRNFGVPVFDADQAVHELTGPGGAAVKVINTAFPGSVKDHAVDRRTLGAMVFDDPESLRRLEQILHPLVRQAQERFLKRARGRRETVVVLEIPLLFETGGDWICDGVAVVSAPVFIQRQRVRARSGMTEEKLAAILARQVPDAVKRRRADFIIPTGYGRGFSLRRIRNLVRMLRSDSDPEPGSPRHHARNSARYGNHRSQPGGRPPHRRDRLHRAV
jgi:dephospho-CoA kinase